MKIETRPHGLVLVSECEEESQQLDQFFGTRVNDYGQIVEGEQVVVRNCECRLSDGYGEHYVFIQGNNGRRSEIND